MDAASQQQPAAALEIIKRIESFADAYRGDPEFRARADENLMSVLAEQGMELPPPGVELRIVENTADVYHIVLPPDPSVPLSSEALDMVAGGKSASTIGFAGSGYNGMLNWMPML